MAEFFLLFIVFAVAAVGLLAAYANDPKRKHGTK